MRDGGGVRSLGVPGSHVVNRLFKKLACKARYRRLIVQKEVIMTLTRLNNIANRQRRHLVSDVLLAGLAVFIIAIQAILFSGSNVPVATSVPHLPQETIYIYGTAPSTTNVQPDAVATVPTTPVIPGS